MARLLDKLKHLSPGERDALFLVYMSDLNFKQAAIALGVPEGTVASRISRAKAKLRANSAPEDSSNNKLSHSVMDLIRRGGQ
jgi:RNA polymerase sigma factor (sigma-70 family)